VETMNAYYNIPWLHLRLGDLVYREDDERHTGTIRAIANSAEARVVWTDNGWTSWEPLAELRKVRR
jgi:hypothetical protein